MQTVDITPKADSEFWQYSEPLNFLVVVPADSVLPSLISHWASPESLARYIHVYTHLQAGQIKLLQDHKSHGTFHLPCSGLNISRFLHHQIVDLNTHSADTEMLSKLSPRLLSDQSASTTEVVLFSIQVLCEDNKNWLVPEKKLVWRWVKPQSMYRTSGRWEASLAKVFFDAEWSAGTGISILVGSVDEEKFREIEKRNVS
ncbi:hypothetical protein IQ06DRAFT_304910 [Phaeosphaeriaceae sp. SRC1lsM3a]|nr:hypothetical protein IQ06DRAFT_304910 [Stagonospora sp. SRC1lsM3a]